MLEPFWVPTSLRDISDVSQSFIVVRHTSCAGSFWDGGVYRYNFCYNVKVMGKKNSKKTIVIFGVSGFVGSNLAEILGVDYRVIGTYFRNPVNIPNALTVSCNVLNKEEILLILFTFRPDIAVYCASTSSLLECSEDETVTNAINTVGIFNVMEGCQRYHTQVCYISSNYVFSGKDKIYTETDVPEPNTIYGKSQSTIEFYLQKVGLNYTIFRICKMYGIGISPYRLNWFEYLQKMFDLNEHIDCDDYIHIGFLDIHYFAMILKLCFKENTTNRLFQISSSDICTHYEFAQKYCDIFSTPLSLLDKSRWNMPFVDDSLMSKNDDDLYYMMDLSNIEAFLSVKMPSIKESLEFSRKKANLNGQKCG